MGNGVVVGPKTVKLLAGKTYHLSPQSWSRLYLPFKLDEVHGSVTITPSLSREGVISGPVVTAAGILQLSVFNSTLKVVRIAPATPLIVIRGFSSVSILRTQPITLAVVETPLENEVTNELLEQEVKALYGEVCDLSEHPVLPEMQKLMVRADEVSWQEPTNCGQRTPFKTEEMACRRKVAAQIETYIQRGYLRRVSCGERVFLSPLLPLAKADGSYRFTTDFRALNAHFERQGQSQVDVWRRLWALNPAWRFFSKLDLKDGFFGIPVDPRLQRLFAFSWQDCRFCWQRLPQGWTWSSVLFGERIAEVVEGIEGTVQFADDLLIAGETRIVLRERLHLVFQRLKKFGLKVNVTKATLLTRELKFLGVEIANGHWSLCNYLRQKIDSLGAIRTWKAIERLIGVVSYARKTLPDVERLLVEARTLLKQSKHTEQSMEWWSTAERQLNSMLCEAVVRQRILVLPGLGVENFVIESDWSDDFCGYLLYANDGAKLHLCDVGSKKMPERTSSFLGELKAVIWACKSTKAFRGDLPLVIRTDNQSVVRVLSGSIHSGADKRVFRLWGWIVENETFEVEYIPGQANVGADLLSRPILATGESSTKHVDVGVITLEQRRRIETAHRGHYGWAKTFQNLQKQNEPVWLGASKDVKEFVKRCPNCVKHGPLKKRPVFSPWVSDFPNDTIFSDIAGPLSWGRHQRKVWVVVLVDGYSRYAQIRLTDRPNGTAVVAAVDQWIRRFGCPRTLFMDQGTPFTSLDVAEFCQRFGIARVWCGIRAPWSNGVSERMIKTMTERLRRIGNVVTWPMLLRRVEDEYNNTVHSGVQATPREVFCGVTPTGEAMVDSEWQAVLVKARDTTTKARLQRKNRFEKAHRSREEINVGDEVLYMIPQQLKLDKTWEGPAIVVERIGSRLFKLVMGELELGPFHYWQLKRFTPQ